MSRRRYLSTEITTDPDLGEACAELSYFGALLFSWCIVHAEDDATFPRDPRKLKYLVLAMFPQTTTDDVEKALQEFLRLGLIADMGDRLMFKPSSFYKIQSYIKADRRTDQSVFDAAIGLNSECVELRRNSTQTAASPSPSPSLTLKESPPPLPPHGGPALSEGRKAKAGEASKNAARRRRSRALDVDKWQTTIDRHKARFLEICKARKMPQRLGSCVDEFLARQYERDRGSETMEAALNVMESRGILREKVGRAWKLTWLCNVRYSDKYGGGPVNRIEEIARGEWSPEEQTAPHVCPKCGGSPESCLFDGCGYLQYQDAVSRFDSCPEEYQRIIDRYLEEHPEEREVA